MKTILIKNGYLLNKKMYNKKELDKVKKELSVKPFKPFNFGVNSKNEIIQVYQENNEYLSVPKFYGLKHFGKPEKNKEYDGLKIKLKFKGKLRNYQEIIANKTLNHINNKDGGLISIGCGRGKTVLALYLCTQLNVKTLVIVHKTFLLNQWKERANQFTNAKIGIIQQKKIDIENKDIVIGMLQSIAKDKYDTSVFKDFGLVIFDEAHHAPSKYFSRALPIISCKKSLALSATPKRTDRLDKILYWYLGDMIYKDKPNENKNVIVKLIKYNLNHSKFREARLPYTGEINRPKTLNKLVQLKKRNKFIINQLQEILEESGRKVLLLSDRIEHLKNLKERIDKKNFTTVDFYIGGMTEKKLKKAEDAQVLLGTYGMASEALDIPSLNTLIMSTPRTNIKQSVGRILRKKNLLIQPLIIDYIDQLNSFVRQGESRKRFYRKLNYTIFQIDVEDNIILSEEEITNKINKVLTIESNDIDFID